MKRLCLAGLTLAAATMPGAVNAANETRGMQTSRSESAVTGTVERAAGYNWGGRQNGRWVGGARAPGGWNAYRPAARGFVLPRYWVQPRFFIGNFARYGFSSPQAGYGWSRYYDDAVLTDRSGRVYDSFRGVNWDQYDRYDDAGSEDYADSYGYRDDGNSQIGRDERPARLPDRDGGAGGAVIGGVVGAVAGNVIGGRGNRLGGSLIGGGLGAIAGAVIDKNDRAGRGSARNNDRGYDDRRYDDRGYDDRYGHSGPHWQGNDDYYRGQHHGGGRVIYRSAPSRGYYYTQPETIVTVHSAPIVTTTTYVTEEVSYVAAAKRRHVAPKRKHKHKPRPKPRCTC